MLDVLLAFWVGANTSAATDELRAQLAAVKRIHVERLAGGEVAHHIRDMIIGSLQRTGRFVITENPERADVFLRGSAEDMVFTDTFQSSEGVNARTAVNLGSGAGNNRRGLSTSAGVGDNESVRIQERKHEAAAAVRLVNKDGDVLWSATKESLGAKFRGASADVAEKLTEQLLEDIDRARRPAP